MGRLFECELLRQFYSCRACSAHLATFADVVSKNFQSRNGKAYLFNTVINVNCGVLEDKTMLTGPHTVADIYCNKCHQLLGWKYVTAYNANQKYKEGRFILERCKIKQGDSDDFLVRPGNAQNNANRVVNGNGGQA